MTRIINNCDMCGELMVAREVYDYEIGLKIVMECECGHRQMYMQYQLPVERESEC